MCCVFSFVSFVFPLVLRVVWCPLARQICDYWKCLDFHGPIGKHGAFGRSTGRVTNWIVIEREVLDSGAFIRVRRHSYEACSCLQQTKLEIFYPNPDFRFSKIRFSIFRNPLDLVSLGRRMKSVDIQIFQNVFFLKSTLLREITKCMKWKVFPQTTPGYSRLIIYQHGLNANWMIQSRSPTFQVQPVAKRIFIFF